MKSIYVTSALRIVAVAVCLLGTTAAPVVAQSIPASTDPPPVDLDPRGVAILPFANISGNPTDDWLGAGIADTVAADLTQLGLASVVASGPRNGSSAPGNAGLGLADDLQARALARRLGVGWAVTGGYQRVGEQLRLIARVVHVDSGDVHRTVTLDGAAHELFALQDRIVAELGEAFTPVARREPRPDTVSPAPSPAEGRGPVPVTGSASPPLATGAVGADAGPGGTGAGATSREPSVPVRSAAPGGVPSTVGFVGPGTPAFTTAGAEYGSLAGRPVVRPTRTDTPPNVDGRIDDAVWQSAASITSFVQESPLDGAPATENTEVRIAYDSQNIYLAFHAHYSDMGLVRANRVDRDQANEDDLIAVYFDPFLDQQRAYVFDVNGYGVQGDGIINTFGGGRGGGRGRRGGGGDRGGAVSVIPNPDRSWDALFDTAAQIVADGFTAEMVIPIKSLRYPQLGSNTPHRWGFQVVRSIKSKDNEADVWSPMSRDVQGFMTQMGVLEGMTGLSTSRNLEFLPTFTGIQFGSLDSSSGGFPEEFDGQGGLDVKYGITSNLTANFTFNPDFSQIESDVAQIDVNQRFPLFFPELRPFFLEGQEIFNIFSPVNWVNTRTIVDPRFGAKLTGKVGDLAIGLLAADDEAPGKGVAETDPAFGKTAQVLIARARYDLYAGSHVGGLVTDRQFLDGYSRAVGMDGQFRVGQTAQANFIAFQTMNRDLEGIETSGQAWGVFLQRNGRNLRMTSFAGSNHPDAATDVGFLRRNDTQEFNSNVSYRWWPATWVINWGPRVRYQRLYDYDWILADEVIDTGFDFTFAQNISAGAGVERALEHFGGIDFWKTRYTVNANVGTSRVVSVGGRFGWGDQIFFSQTPFLGRGMEGSLNVFFRPIARLQSQINFDTSRLRDLRSGDVEVFDIKLFRALTTYQFTERLLLRNITEFNTFADTVGLNVLATYRINAGTVFFVGYDDRYQQRDMFDPMGDDLVLRRAYQRTNRAVFTKLQVLFRM